MPLHSSLGDRTRLHLKKKNHKKPHNVLRKFTDLHWAAFKAMLGCIWPVGHGLDKLELGNNHGLMKRYDKGECLLYAIDNKRKLETT